MLFASRAEALRVARRRGGRQGRVRRWTPPAFDVCRSPHWYVVVSRGQGRRGLLLGEDGALWG